MLSLTSKSLTSDVKHVAGEIGINAASAAVGAMAGCAIAREAEGARAILLGAATVGGGALMAIKGKGKIVPYAGVGFVLGGVWGFIGKPPERRRGWSF